MKTKICKVCGKIFTAKNAMKYCSKKCASEVKYYTPKGRGMGDTICWNCKKATGSCSWSSRFIPVKGWVAVPTEIKGNLFSGEILKSYCVKECPKFIRG